MYICTFDVHTFENEVHVSAGFCWLLWHKLVMGMVARGTYGTRNHIITNRY